MGSEGKKVPKISRDSYAMMLNYQLLFTIQALTPFVIYKSLDLTIQKC